VPWDKSKWAYKPIFPPTGTEIGTGE